MYEKTPLALRRFMAKQTLGSNAARAALARGLDKVADAVKVTLGPRGRNVLLDRPGQPLATRDGVTVAKEMANLPDPFEQMGALYAREVADACVTEAGDGTTTGTVILQAIVKEGLKLVDAGAEPLLLADGIAMAAAACAQSVKAMSIEATPELVRQAAIISTHGDVELGTLIAEATCKVGATGVLELQESRDENTTIEHLGGFYFERGWKPHQWMARDKSGQKCVLKNPYILISERLIVGATQGLKGDHLNNIAEQVAKTRRPLLIVAEDLQGDALQYFAVNLQAGNIQGCFVKLPGFGDQRAAAIEDLRIACGAKKVHSQVSQDPKDQLSSFTVADLGWCEEAVISPSRTVLIGGGANEVLKTKRIKQLIDQSQEAANAFERESLDHRIARLTGGVAVLRVGAHSEPAMIEKKSRAEDAIHACRGALEEGVVPGAGMALLLCAAMFHVEGPLKDGSQVLLKAICEPAKQIMRNAARDFDAPLKGARRDRPAWGFNAATGESGDLYKFGIVDPTKVVLTALQKAASIGALILTSEVMVCDIPEDKAVPQMPAAFRG
jgi:chaperonin GroEL